MVSPRDFFSLPRINCSKCAFCKSCKSVKQRIIFEDRKVLWADGQVALGYIRNQTKKFKIFVANKVQFIQDNTKKDQWKHIPMKQNPADLASRGIEADSADRVHVWNYGSDFLWTDESKWNKYDIDCNIQEDDTEVNSMKVNVATIQSSILKSLEGIGSWIILRRIAAWIILFKDKFLKWKPEDTDAGMTFNVNLLNEAE